MRIEREKPVDAEAQEPYSAIKQIGKGRCEQE